jgi:uncharacterized membrane protein YdfJ with MMPL/SSD domain
MSRTRAAVSWLGQRSGIAAAVALTGGVVSCCGLVMVAGFSRLLSNAVASLRHVVGEEATGFHSRVGRIAG